jgi:AbiV family abortive infection protein
VANLARASDVAYTNAVATLEDAKLLFDAARYPRACALAVLAEEEFGKALVLRSCASQPRWDAAVFGSLRDNQTKQGIASAGRAYFTWLRSNLERVEQLNRSALIPVTPALFPGKEAWDKLLTEARAAMTSSVRDHEKQAALYVSIDLAG